MTDIPGWVISIAEQAPSLVVLTWLVHTFLKHIDKKDEAGKASQKECHEVQMAASAALSENTRVLGRSLHVIERLEKRQEQDSEIRRNI